MLFSDSLQCWFCLLDDSVGVSFQSACKMCFTIPRDSLLRDHLTRANSGKLGRLNKNRKSTMEIRDSRSKKETVLTHWRSFEITDTNDLSVHIWQSSFQYDTTNLRWFTEMLCEQDGRMVGWRAIHLLRSSSDGILWKPTSLVRQLSHIQSSLSRWSRSWLKWNTTSRNWRPWWVRPIYYSVHSILLHSRSTSASSECDCLTSDSINVCCKECFLLIQRLFF